jgi:hypothetical protein
VQILFELLISIQRVRKFPIFMVILTSSYPSHKFRPYFVQFSIIFLCTPTYLLPLEYSTTQVLKTKDNIKQSKTERIPEFAAQFSDLLSPRYTVISIQPFWQFVEISSVSYSHCTQSRPEGFASRHFVLTHQEDSSFMLHNDKSHNLLDIKDFTMRKEYELKPVIYDYLI